MNPLSKKYKKDWEFFINPKTGKVQYNAVCLSCTQDCKQSYKAEIVQCNHYEKYKEEQNAKRNEN